MSCCSCGMTTKLLLRLEEDLGEDFTEPCSTASELLLLLPAQLTNACNVQRVSWNATWLKLNQWWCECGQ